MNQRDARSWQTCTWGRARYYCVLISAVFAINIETALADEFHRFESVHLELVTDLNPSPEIEQLPRLFDEGMREAAAYFGIDSKRLRGWKLTGYLIGQSDRFRRAGFLHDKVPPFENGYQLGDEFWFNEQPSHYYRRHLMLHEGMHALMYRFLGGAGPPWYREGMAEMLSTHRLSKEGKLQLNQLPMNRREYPEWGRIGKLRESIGAGRSMSLVEVMSIPYRKFNTVETYSWGWLACIFLDRHPAFRNCFQSCHGRLKLANAEFNAMLLRELRECDESVDTAWRLIATEMDYGYVVSENRITHLEHQGKLGRPFRIQSNLGWQGTGITVKAGANYRLRSAGRFLLDGTDARWVSEPGGVTIEYRQGAPRGQLLLAVHAEDDGLQPSLPDEDISFWQPLRVGRAADWIAPRTGVVFLRINEPAGERADNRGELKVQIEPRDDAG